MDWTKRTKDLLIVKKVCVYLYMLYIMRLHKTVYITFLGSEDILTRRYLIHSLILLKLRHRLRVEVCPSVCAVCKMTKSHTSVCVKTVNTAYEGYCLKRSQI